MNILDFYRFEEAQRLARSGEKQTAYMQFCQLRDNDNQENIELLFWIIFTTPSPVEMQDMLYKIEHIAPAHPKLADARAFCQRHMLPHGKRLRISPYKIFAVILIGIILACGLTYFVGAHRSVSGDAPDYLKQAVASGASVSAEGMEADDIDNAGIITITIGETSDLANDIRSTCFDVMKALWQQSASASLDFAQVTVEAHLVDKYGNESVGIAGSCTLKRQTARLVNWDNLSFDTAWNNHIYDAEGMLPSLSQ